MGTPRQPSLFYAIRQVLVSHRSHCLNCDASIDARNAQAWATLHVKRNPGHEDLRAPCFAVHCQKPPQKTEGGTSYGLRFPMLIMAHYLEQPEEVAKKVADILNKYWDDEA